MKTVVIDAGHGGKDPGNLGTGRYKTREKDIALDVALRVGGYIKQHFPEINVVYTRSTDVFIGLQERADIANNAKADLFISIHCNAFNNPNSNGVETYVLGLHRNEENLQVAMKENSAIFLEEDYKTKYEGFDPNSPESIIALTIMQSAFLQQSLSISAYIQKQFKERVGRRDRGVKQAGFLVLRRTTMPSILVELGFLTNTSEEDFLNTENGKAFMSSAIFRGFREYKELVEDPLPEGYVPEDSGSKVSEKETQKEIDERMAAAEQAKLDSVKNVEKQAQIKAVADSLEREKQRLLDEKRQREEALRLEEQEKKARLKAQADSLEQVRKAKLEEMKRRQEEIAAKKAQEEAELKLKEEQERLAQEEKALKAQEAKENAKEWLEEIKAEKEKELQEAKTNAAIDEEKKRLEAIKEEKRKQLEEVRKQAEKDSLHALVEQRIAVKKEQAKRDSILKAETILKEQQDSIARVAAKEDSLSKARLAKEELEKNKQRQDSIAAVQQSAKSVPEVQVGEKKAATPEEAELLFLQLRKKQLEERIARLKGQNVSVPTMQDIEQRAASKQAPKNKVNSNVENGIVLKVQVVTASEPLSNDDPRFLGETVWEYQQGGLYKYTVGSTQDFEEITKLQTELRDLGFKGAFVVAFKDGVRIKVSEARKILQ